jgi:hypothetical protein
MGDNSDYCAGGLASDEIHGGHWLFLCVPLYYLVIGYYMDTPTKTGNEP